MRLLRIFGNVAMTSICVLAVAFAALSLMSKGAPSSTRGWAGGYKPFVVLSGSMEPAVHVGGVLLVRRVDASTVRTGDIITFVTPHEPGASESQSFTTHRVVAVKTERQGGLAFSTKGDANQHPDLALVPAANVLGSAVISVPYLGYVSRFASTKTGLLSLIVGPAILLILVETVSLIRGRSHEGTQETARESQ